MYIWIRFFDLWHKKCSQLLAYKQAVNFSVQTANIRGKKAKKEVPWWVKYLILYSTLNYKAYLCIASITYIDRKVLYSKIRTMCKWTLQIIGTHHGPPSPAQPLIQWNILTLGVQSHIPRGHTLMTTEQLTCSLNTHGPNQKGFFALFLKEFLCLCPNTHAGGFVFNLSCTFEA